MRWPRSKLLSVRMLSLYDIVRMEGVHSLRTSTIPSLGGRFYSHLFYFSTRAPTTNGDGWGGGFWVAQCRCVEGEERPACSAMFEMFFKVKFYERSSSLSVLLCLPNLLPSRHNRTRERNNSAVVPSESVLVRAKKLTRRFRLGLAPAGRGGMGVGEL
mmetsp:Transcript_11497/g.18487  ORF Transcript_11497/g.18487 Transcript_11497/m.18487 type:complete len:158 (+) Transcript_11497:87-560(+)